MAMLTTNNNTKATKKKSKSKGRPAKQICEKLIKLLPDGLQRERANQMTVEESKNECGSRKNKSKPYTQSGASDHQRIFVICIKGECGVNLDLYKPKVATSLINWCGYHWKNHHDTETVEKLENEVLL